MKLSASHPANQRLLRSFEKRKRSLAEPITPADRHPDPYWQAGSHPDVVERVWDDLGASLPVDCRAIVYGTPALVHPEAGAVFAMAYGTQYIIRVPDSLVGETLRAGCRIEQTWTGGGKTNIEAELGRGWVFGCWAEQETRWLALTYSDLGSSA